MEEEFLRVLLGGVEHCEIFMLDPDGRVTNWGAGGRRITGYTDNEIIGRHVSCFYTSEEIARGTPDRQLQVAAEQGRLEDEGWRARKDGSQFWAHVVTTVLRDPDGRLHGFGRVVRDLTDRKQAEQALRDGEERFQQLAENIQEVFWLTNAEGTNVIYVSPAYERIWGRSLNSGDATAAFWLNAVDSADRSRIEAARAGLISGRYDEEYRIVRPDGSVRWIRDRALPIRKVTGEIDRIARIAEDITQRKELEEQLRAVAARLISAQDEERRRLSRELHDDLNQKLAMFVVEIEMLERRSVLTAEVRQQLRSLGSGLATLSDDVRRLAYQLHPSVLDDLGLAIAVRSQIDEFMRREGTPVAYTVQNLPEQLPRDIASCLFRVIQESLRNIARHASAPAVAVTLEGTTRSVRLTIEDRGLGFPIDSEHREGLGIVSMRERVRLMDGTFDIRSQPGQGTRVSVSIPLPMKTP